MKPDIHQRNNISVRGQGSRPIIFAHGFGSDQHMWRLVTPAFEAEYKVVLFDYVGSGCSDNKAYHEERYASLQGYVQDVLEICAGLDLRDAIFVGHSVSAMIGMLAAIAAPQYISKLVMIGPSPRYLNDTGYYGGFERSDIDNLFETMDKNYIGWANFLAPALMAQPDKPELGQELVQSFCATDPAIAKKFARVTFFSDHRGDLQRSKIPVLIMQCTDDIVAPVEVGAYLHRHLPNSTLRVMKATGHCPHISASEETIELIKAFLQPQQTIHG